MKPVLLTGLHEAETPGRGSMYYERHMISKDNSKEEKKIVRVINHIHDAWERALASLYFHHKRQHRPWLEPTLEDHRRYRYPVQNETRHLEERRPPCREWDRLLDGNLATMGIMICQELDESTPGSRALMALAPEE